MPTNSTPIQLFSYDHVRGVAEQLYQDYLHLVGRETLATEDICFDTLYEEIIYPKFEVRLNQDLDLGYDGGGKKILGLFDVRGNVAFVNKTLRGDPRWTFTRYHEVVGHGVLQGEYLRQFSGKDTLVSTEDGQWRVVLDRLEQQANRCASYAAAPPPLVAHSLENVYGISRSRPLWFAPSNRFCLWEFGEPRYHQIGSFEELCRILASAIQPRFDGLSVQALSYRVGALQSIIVDCTPPDPWYLKRVA